MWLASNRRLWRVALIVYWGGAVILAPWIVYLFLSQSPTGNAYHLQLVGAGIAFGFVAGTVCTGVLCVRQSDLAVIAAVFTATLAFVTAWFNLLGLVHHVLDPLVFVAALYSLPIIFMAWVADLCAGISHGGVERSRMGAMDLFRLARLRRAGVRRVSAPGASDGAGAPAAAGLDRPRSL